jgi:hypothetical protein
MGAIAHFHLMPNLKMHGASKMTSALLIQTRDMDNVQIKLSHNYIRPLSKTLTTDAQIGLTRWRCIEPCKYVEGEGQARNYSYKTEDLMQISIKGTYRH